MHHPYSLSVNIHTYTKWIIHCG